MQATGQETLAYAAYQAASYFCRTPATIPTWQSVNAVEIAQIKTTVTKNIDSDRPAKKRKAADTPTTHRSPLPVNATQSTPVQSNIDSIQSGQSISMLPSPPTLPDMQDPMLQQLLQAWYQAGYATGFYQGTIGALVAQNIYSFAQLSSILGVNRCQVTRPTYIFSALLQPF
jgi:hypothetical protein